LSDDLVQSVDEKNCERRRLTISELSSEFLQVLRNMRSKNAPGCAQNAENGFGFDFLERYRKDGDTFFNHAITSEMYCETLKKMCRAIQNKKRGILTYGVPAVLLP
jgi:hypothetical protein